MSAAAQPVPRSPAVRAVEIADLLAAEFPPRTVLMEPWLPSQGLAMLYGLRGVGKTHVSLGVAVAVASGDRFLVWRAGQPRGVLFLDGEMPGAALQERLASIIAHGEKEPGAPLRIITPDLQEDGMPDLATKRGQEAIEAHLDGISLIIVDNISTLCRSGRENEAEGWLPVQAWALRMRARGFSILFIHHAGKGGQQRGTSKREDVLDSVLVLRRPADYDPANGAHFELHYEKARGAYGEAVRPFEARLTPTGWRVKSLEESTRERVAAMFNEGMSQSEIAAELGIHRSNVCRHIQKAKAEGLLKATEKRS